MLDNSCAIKKRKWRMFSFRLFLFLYFLPSQNLLTSNVCMLRNRLAHEKEKKKNSGIQWNALFYVLHEA